MSKNLTIAPSPSTNEEPTSDPPLISQSEVDSLKRLTIDIPAVLHARIKSQCALRGIKMAEEIRLLLETHFPAA